jgi:hypothetical protein
VANNGINPASLKSAVRIILIFTEKMLKSLLFIEKISAHEFAIEKSIEWSRRAELRASHGNRSLNQYCFKSQWWAPSNSYLAEPTEFK